MQIIKYTQLSFFNENIGFEKVLFLSRDSKAISIPKINSDESPLNLRGDINASRSKNNTDSTKTKYN